MSDFMQGVGDQLVAHATERADEKHRFLVRRFLREAAEAVGGHGLPSGIAAAIETALAPLLPKMVERQIQKTQDALAATVVELAS